MNNSKRAIVIFTRFENMQTIEQIRSQFDPLVKTINPHITLIFPFESNFSTDQLCTHIRQALQGIKPFPVLFHGVTGSEGEYLFLNIKQGNDAIIELHDRLYSGILSEFYHNENTYVPHLTLGRIQQGTNFLKALETASQMREDFQTIIEDIAVYQLGGINSTQLIFKF